MFLTDTIPISEALSISLLGLLVVFCMLVLLMLVIGILSRVVGGTKKSGPEAAPQKAEAAPAPAPPEAPGSCGGIKLYNVPPRQAAMVMAIVANELNVPLNTLRFISIKAVDEGGNEA